MEDARVPQLRAKLGISENADDDHYDAKVAEAVRKFQETAELKPTGMLDDKTVKAINSPKRDKQIDTVIVNMERWRWLPRDLGAPGIGDAYVILNIPDYTLKVMQHGAQVWTTKVVTGKPGIHATPLLTETMKFITVNPTWNVPPSIIYNEYLPALQQDPTVLQRMGLKLERARDGSIHISQPPGEANALGRIRFNFPNKFLVYQHDTPDKNLFAKSERAFSHGCMRVQYPDQYASVLLNITRAERALHAGKDPQHVWPQRDRPEIPDPDPGQHHLPDRVRGRRRQAAVPQGRLRPRRHHAGAAASGPEARIWKTWSRIRSRATSAADRQLPAGVSFASDNGSSGPLFGPLVFRAAVRRPPAPPAPVPAGGCRSGGFHPLIVTSAAPSSNFATKSTAPPSGGAVCVNHSPPRI